MRDAEPPPQDIEVGPPAMSAQESGPPWDEEAGQTSPAARAPAGLNRPDIAVMALQEQPDTTRWLALARPLLDAGRLSGFVRELAWQSQCLACSGDQVHDTAADATPLPIQVTLRVPRESLRQAQLRDRLQAHLSEHLGGRAVQIEVLSGPVHDSAALRDAAAKAHRQVDAETLVNEHPRVLALLTRFAGAFVVPGSIRPVS
jgi:DNA polymerase-3 subunit gamma/tau